VLSTLSFVGPSRDGTNKLSPGDRGHYSCQFENQVNFSFICVRLNSTLCAVHLTDVFTGPFLSWSQIIIWNCKQMPAVLYILGCFSSFSNLRSAFLCAISKHYMCKVELLKSLKTVIVIENDNF
jgi:hypothetical protein